MICRIEKKKNNGAKHKKLFVKSDLGVRYRMEPVKVLKLYLTSRMYFFIGNSQFTSVTFISAIYFTTLS